MVPNQKKKWITPKIVRLPYDERTQALFEQAPPASGTSPAEKGPVVSQGAAA
jgi:hypothetical protein